jgi:hypothetical protein
MKTIINSFMTILALISVLFIFNSSCTIIGLSVGASVDRDHKKNDTIEAVYLKKINKGRKVELKLTNGNLVQGEYIGKSSMPQEKYAEIYSQFIDRHPGDLSIPKIGDTIDIYDTKLKSSKRGELISLKTDAIELGDLYYNKTIRNSIDTINNFIYNHGKPFMLSKYKDLPRINLVKIKDTNGKILTFEVNEIEVIYVNYKYRAKLSGALIGLSTDLAVIAILISLFSMSGGLGLAISM